MPSKIDLSTKKFGRLQPLYPTTERKNKSVVWVCKCDCGNTKNVPAANLNAGRILSCGCLKQESDRKPKNNHIDLIGQKFGHLLVIKRDSSDQRGEAKWLCQCDCENESIISVLSSNLRTGHTTSCGCERRSHGEIKVGELLLKYHIPFETEKWFFKYDNGHIAPFDFYVQQKYLIEFDGETHDLTHSGKHGWLTEESIQRQLTRDELKNQWCKDHNIPLIRIPYTKLKTLCIEDLLLETTKFRVC